MMSLSKGGELTAGTAPEVDSGSRFQRSETSRDKMSPSKRQTPDQENEGGFPDECHAFETCPRIPELIAGALADDITAAAALTTGEKFICRNC